MIIVLQPETISPQDPFLNPGHWILYTITGHQLTGRGLASRDNQYATHYTIGAAHYTSRLLNINSLSPDNAGSFPPRVSSLPGTAWALSPPRAASQSISHIQQSHSVSAWLLMQPHEPLPLFNTIYQPGIQEISDSS